MGLVRRKGESWYLSNNTIHSFLYFDLSHSDSSSSYFAVSIEGQKSPLLLKTCFFV